MPTYLCHGFRWDRRSIRVYVVVQDLDDAAPEWIVGPRTAATLLRSFYTLFDFLPGGPPTTTTIATTAADDADADADADDGVRAAPGADDDNVLAHDWSAIKLLEEHDPAELAEASRPHAYVADFAVRVDLSAAVGDEIARYEAGMRRDAKAAGRNHHHHHHHRGPMHAAAATSDEGDAAARRKGAPPPKNPGWFERLRDQLQRGEDIRWYVVVCGDEERAAPDVDNGGRCGGAAQASRAVSPDREQLRAALQRELLGPEPGPAGDEAGEEGEGDRRGASPAAGGDRTPRAGQARGRRNPVAQPAPTVGPEPPALKTPRSGGFRRLFSRGKGSDDTP